MEGKNGFFIPLFAFDFKIPEKKKTIHGRITEKKTPI